MAALKIAKTYVAKPKYLSPSWHVFDAAQQPLGRMVVEIARILQGKHQPAYTAHINTGDYVVVVNANTLGCEAGAVCDSALKLMTVLSPTISTSLATSTVKVAVSLPPEFRLPLSHASGETVQSPGVSLGVMTTESLWAPLL